MRLYMEAGGRDNCTSLEMEARGSSLGDSFVRDFEPFKLATRSSAQGSG
jgi:hypothetical protein